MEKKKKAEITVGSIVRVVKVKQSFEKRFLGMTGMVVSVIKGCVLDCFPDSFAPERIRVRLDHDFFWFDEDQVQLDAHKFKVGDTVRVTNNPPAHMSRSLDGILWISAMSRYCGHLYRIKEVHEIGYTLNDSGEILFSEEWLKPAFPDKPKPSPKRTIVIEITDDGADAKYVCGKEVRKTASIKRHPDDKPDDETAAVLVTEKLFGRNLRNLESAVDEDFRLHSETLGWIHGAKEALDEAEKRIKKLI